jgi:hypothetical protein
MSFVENFPLPSIQRLIKKGKEKERGQRLKNQRFIFYLSIEKSYYQEGCIEIVW